MADLDLKAEAVAEGDMKLMFPQASPVAIASAAIGKDEQAMFFADTALFGAFSATKCGLEFFGVDNVLFASDCPFDPEKGPGYIRETIKIIDDLPISETERQSIYEGNARRIMKL